MSEAKSDKSEIKSGAQSDTQPKTKAAKARYEIVFIVRPDVASNHAEQLTEKFSQLVKENGGKFLKSEQWGLRSLAYRVKKHRKGYYVLLGVQGTGKMVAEIERNMRISDDVIRFLTVRDDTITDKPSIVMSPRRSKRFDRDDADNSGDGASKKDKDAA